MGHVKSDVDNQTPRVLLLAIATIWISMPLFARQKTDVICDEQRRPAYLRKAA